MEDKIMQIMAGRITQWLIFRGRIQESKKEIMQYGFEITLSTLCTMLSTFFLSLTLFQKGDAIVFVIFFVIVRLFAGGFHASTYFRCYVSSLMIFSAVASVSRVIPIESFILKILILFICSTYLYSSKPHIHENHKVSDVTIQINKMRLKKVIVINLIVISGIHLLSIHYSTMAVYSTMAAGILLSVSEHGVKW